LLDVATLVQRCRHGDDLAWEALVRRYHGRIYAVAYHYLSDADEARDMAQEIFVRIYEQLPSFRRGDRFVPWMIRVARNATIDRLRRQKARPPRQDLPAEGGLPVAAAGPTPEELSVEDSRRRMLYRAMDGMSEKSREILLLKEIQGLKVEEISKMLRVPTGTIKSRASRARIELALRVRQLDPSYGV
jgi:RNA polymerase sigma-70 factor (ECF subfamily)